MEENAAAATANNPAGRLHATIYGSVGKVDLLPLPFLKGNISYEKPSCYFLFLFTGKTRADGQVATTGPARRLPVTGENAKGTASNRFPSRPRLVPPVMHHILMENKNKAVINRKRSRSGVPPALSVSVGRTSSC